MTASHGTKKDLAIDGACKRPILLQGLAEGGSCNEN